MNLKKVLCSFSLYCLSASTMVGSVYADQRSDIEQRIKPIGQVQIIGDDSTKIKKEEPVAAQPKVQAAAMSGKDIYTKFCVVCHGAGVAGAPKLKNDTDWSNRVGQKKLDGLLKSAIKGINAMPPKGTCATCSDEELKSAIEYMLPDANKKK